MPIAPSGARPSSTLSPDRRPAARLPSADPDQRHTPSTIRPTGRRAPGSACRRARSRAEAARRGTRSRKCRRRSATARGPRGASSTPSQISAQGLRRIRWPGAAAGAVGDAKLVAVPTTAMASDRRGRSTTGDPARRVEEVAADRRARRRSRRTCSSPAGRWPATARGPAAPPGGCRTSPGLKKVACSAIRNRTT